MGPDFTRREFGKSLVTALAGLTIGSVQGAEHGALLCEGLTKAVNTLNRQTGTIAPAPPVLHLTRDESQARIDNIFAEAAGLLKQAGAIFAPKATTEAQRDSVLNALAERGLFLYVQEVDQNGERFLPIVKLFTVNPLPVEQLLKAGITETKARCFEILNELTQHTSENILPPFSALTKKVGASDSLIVVNPAQCDRDLEQFKAAGISVEPLEYRRYILRNEVASHTFLETYGHPSGINRDRVATFPNGGVIHVSFLQLSEAYADWQSLRNDSTAAVSIIRLLGADVPQYAVSRNILAATLRKLTTANPEDFNGVGDGVLSLARKISDDPAMRERLTTLLISSYTSAFEKVFLPTLKNPE
jgi:hypothetical protein